MTEPLPLFMQSWFKSDRCEDFSTKGNEGRPINADSQSGKLVALLVQGGRYTIADMRRAMRSENAKARLSEVRVWLKGHNIEINQEWRVENDARFLEYWLSPLDCVVAYEKMKKKA